MKNLVAATAIVLTALLTNVAHATIILNPGAALASGNEGPSVPAVMAAIAPYLGTSEELYRSNSPDNGGVGTDEKFFLDAYKTTFNGDNSGALIEWLGPEKITTATHLLVKDGNQSPSWYLFDLFNIWDGMEDIQLTGFWPAQGAISLTAVFGHDDITTDVPEPGSLALLGVGLVGLAATRRKKYSR